MRVRAASGWLVLSIALCGCGDDATPSLIVDLKTDLVPVVEFVGASTEVSSAPFVAGAARGPGVEVVVSGDQDFLRGVRIAEIDGLSAGPLYVRVSALAAGGGVVVGRVTSVNLRGRLALTVVLTRTCSGVTCPPEGAPNLIACHGGRCVDPACSPEDPTACGDGQCDSAHPCAAGPPCVALTCASGACLATPDDAACLATQRCDVTLGCVARDMMTPDAGHCAARETACTDGDDDDCDGATDCADDDCDAVSCGGNGELCAAGVCACPGSSPEGDCGNALDDDCDGAADCADTDCAALVCGPRGETCAGTACACPGSAPETDCGDGVDGDCDGMRDCADSDCDTLACGTAGQICTAGTCSCTGASTETVCDNALDDDCDGATDCADTDCDTRVCGAQDVGAWGACGGYSNACDTTGTQSRTITDRACGGSACHTMSTTETRACTRTVADGTSCGTTWMRCCAGTCVNLATDDRHCGACRVDCTGIGTCERTGSGGYICRGCASNAQCRSELDANATCYDVTAPPAFCQCQCTSGTYSSRVCANAGCGAGFYCHACSGDNFCAPFGGTCP